MTQSTPDVELSPVKRALLEIRELRARLSELENKAREPIAIVGMSIRAPGGVTDQRSFEHLLFNGIDAIGPIPGERWNLDEWYDADGDAPGKMTTREGGFVDNVDRFDAEFFGIAPVEAASMDPQQRLALELAWEALEDSGHAPDGAGAPTTGVFLGIANADYGRALFSHPQIIDPYFSQGNAFSVASGRIAYVLGFGGPAVSIDTACSSSLVAVHLACQSLRLGECDRALAGGVNLILTPEVNVNFSKAGMMARDGRCKTFDASADGYVRGEGGAMIVLRRLSDALASGDRILAVVRGSAINQDGRSNGLTAPNGPAQEAVLRAALDSAGIRPAAVGYVETHGTGTSLGDPIEVNALNAVLSEGRDPRHPLAVGSVKTNIGHLEAAAGIAGLLKAVVALQRREIPPHLHLRALNPLVEWETMPIVVPTETTPWTRPAEPGPLLAGVSSFGFSGTNAHVILEEAPPPRVSVATTGATVRTQILALSARDTAALRELVTRFRSALAAPDANVNDLCYTANTGRTHHSERLAVLGTTASDLNAALGAWLNGETHPALLSGSTKGTPQQVAFLFPGQGPQYRNMAGALYAGAPAFREAFDQCCVVLDPLLPQPLHSVVFPEEGSSTPLDETQFAQPAMFAIEIALAALWRAWGVHPAVVMGHSFGEYAAACVAGAISLSDAARMVAARGRLPQSLPRDGAMMVIEASEDTVADAIARNGGRLAIAAANGSTNTVISGERGAVEAVAAELASQGARTKLLRVSHAFHSPLMDPILDSFEHEISGSTFTEPRIPLVSNLTGQVADLDLYGNARYWRRHLREPVRFADAMQSVAGYGITHYIEMSPHPVLLSMGSEVVPVGEWIPSLREGHDAWQVMLQGVQALYCAGADIDWHGVAAGSYGSRTTAPLYPFQRKRHWIDVPVKAGVSLSSVERWSRVASAMDRQAERGPFDLNASSYPDKWSLLGEVTRAHAIDTLRRARLFTRAGERHTTDTVLREAGISHTYHHLIHRWLTRLTQAGVLVSDGDGFTAPRPLEDPNLPALWELAESAFRDNRELFDYVRNCGSLLSNVLCGRESPLETLFPDGSFELARNLYEQSATMRYINQLAAAAFETLATTMPPGRPLRILEVGAGTGGTSSALLAVLPEQNVRYLFTDVSDVFLAGARERFSGRRGLEFGLFNLEQDIEAQGYAGGSFDIIVSANAVHAVKDLRAGLQRLRALLAPGGLLVLVESTTHFEYFDMTTGLIEGWQHFADDLRDDNPLLSHDVWVGALHTAGFERAQAWPPSGSAAEALGQHVLVAQVPGTASEVTGAAYVSVDQNTQAGTARPVANEDWRAKYNEASTLDQPDLMRELVKQQVMTILKLDHASAPSMRDRLMDLGMDSLMAVQLRNALSRTIGVERALPATLMFDYPTIEAIAAHLHMKLGTTASAPSRAVLETTPAAFDAAKLADLTDDDIARMLDEQLGGGAS